MKTVAKKCVFSVWLALFFGAFWSGCSSTPRSANSVSSDSSGNSSGNSSGSSRAQRLALKSDEARSRSRQVSQVRYTLFFGLDGTSPEFEGRVVASFYWKGKNGAQHPLFLDFQQGAIQSLVINGSTLDESQRARLYDGWRIQLPESRLIQGTNRIEIAFTHAYGRNGTGLHRFVDPQDKKVYLYSQAEPYDANRIFPCFDQPDLKAIYELTVEAPEDWAVIANAAERDVVTFDHKASWQFPPTAAFSTYLFALHAGPYEVWKSDADGIPLRLFARKSIKRQVDARGWLEVTRAGLAFFGDRFGVAYPFGKYDQVIVPEFPSGAMENVGAVTFSEDFAFRSRPTLEDLQERADVILHEAAHMWFGNLVTLRWWDGLWLNESFATYAAAWALEHLASEDPIIRREPWAAAVRQSSGRAIFEQKLWAYLEDGSRNTHPIEMEVPDTDASETVFDGITYSKGASTIKQLVAWVGEEDFIEGLRRYFSTFSYRTATTSHFLRAIEEASELPLGDWRKQWLQNPGMNRIEARWSCNPETKKLEQLTLLQSNGPQSTHLRKHRAKVALLYGDGRVLSIATPGRPRKNEPKARETWEWVKFSDPTTEVKSLLGLPCPDFVYPNLDDHDYALVELDPRSLQYLDKHLAQVSSPLLRSQLWASLWHSVLWGGTSPGQFANWFWKHGITEKDPILLTQLLHRMASRSPTQGSVLRWLPDEGARQSLLAKLEKVSRRELMIAGRNPDLRLAWWQMALLSTRDSAWLEGLLSGREKIPGFALEQDRRWEVLRAWAAISDQAPDIAARIQTELKQDPSDEGKKQALSVESTLARSDSKAATLERAVSGRLNLAELKALASGWQSTGHEPLIAPFGERALQALLDASANRSQEEASIVAKAFVPLMCDSPSRARLSGFVGKNAPRLPPGVVQSLNQALDEEERCLRLRAQSASSSTTGQ
ncbi:MAG: aminopeptidase N [Oligoflexia bacterium]